MASDENKPEKPAPPNGGSSDAPPPSNDGSIQPEVIPRKKRKRPSSQKDSEPLLPVRPKPLEVETLPAIHERNLEQSGGKGAIFLAAANMTPAQIKAVDGLAKIFGRLLLTVFCLAIVLMISFFLCWNPNGWSKGLGVVFGGTVIVCFRYYFGGKNE